MKRESFQGILLGIVIMCAVFAFITIAWAAFSSNLTVGGTAYVKAQSWDVAFIKTKDTKYATPAAADPLVGTATNNAELPSSSGLQIDNDHVTVSGTIGTLKQEEDSITYTWYAQNFCTFDADLAVKGTGSGYTNNVLAAAASSGANISLSCALTTGGTDKTSWCDSNIKATLYVTSVGSSDHLLLSGDSSLGLKAATGTSDDTDVLVFKLIVEYVGSVTDTGETNDASRNEVSSEDITITIDGITLIATQHTSGT